MLTIRTQPHISKCWGLEYNIKYYELHDKNATLGSPGIVAAH